MDKRLKRGGGDQELRDYTNPRGVSYMGFKKVFILRGNAKRFKFEPELKVRD